MNVQRPGLFLLGLCCFGLALEGTIRIEDWIRYGTPPFVNAVSQSDLITTDSMGTHGRPNGRFRKWTLDSLGFRGPDISRRPAPGTYRVVVTDASETFGLVEDSGKEFPRQLEDSLNAWVDRQPQTCGGRVRFEVVNAALPGMMLPTVIGDVQGRLATIAPAAVMFYPTPPHYLDLEVPRSRPPIQDGGGWNRLRPLYPRSLGLLREAIKGLVPRQVSIALRRGEIEGIVQSYPAGWQFTSPPEDRLTAFEDDVRRLVGAVRGVGAMPILATHANIFGMYPERRDEELLLMWQRYSPRATGATLIAFDSAANARLRRVAADSGVPLVSVDSAVYASGLEGVFGDYQHLTNLGSAIVAEVAAQGIRQALTTRGGACPEGQPSATPTAGTAPSP